jgi:hypothetical protein
MKIQGTMARLPSRNDSLSLVKKSSNLTKENTRKIGVHLMSYQ